MIFKHISDISIYITSFSHTLIYLWQLTSLSKHEHCTFQNQNAARLFYINSYIFEGNWLSSEKFQWHFNFIW